MVPAGPGWISLLLGWLSLLLGGLSLLRGRLRALAGAGEVARGGLSTRCGTGPRGRGSCWLGGRRCISGLRPWWCRWALHSLFKVATALQHVVSPLNLLELRRRVTAWVLVRMPSYAQHFDCLLDGIRLGRRLQSQTLERLHDLRVGYSRHAGGDDKFRV